MLNGTSMAEKLRRILTVVVLVGLLWTGAVQWKIQSAINQRPPSSADVGIVLGAAMWGDQPSPALRERLEQALKLYREGAASRLIVSGGMGNNSGLTEAEGMANYLIEHGVPVDHIYLEIEARNTYENILFSSRIMEENGWDRAIIISHHYHGARALNMAQFLGLHEPSVSTTDSRVLYMPWHRVRETLAFTKWEFQKLFMIFGLMPQSI